MQNHDEVESRQHASSAVPSFFLSSFRFAATLLLHWAAALSRRATAAELWVARCPALCSWGILSRSEDQEAGSFAARAPTRSRLADPKVSHQQPIFFRFGLSGMAVGDDAGVMMTLLFMLMMMTPQHQHHARGSAARARAAVAAAASAAAAAAAAVAASSALSASSSSSFSVIIVAVVAVVAVAVVAVAFAVVPPWFVVVAVCGALAACTVRRPSLRVCWNHSTPSFAA